MVNARRMHEVLAARRREQKTHRQRAWHGDGSTPPTPTPSQRVRFDTNGYARPASVFPAGALTPDAKYTRRPQGNLATAPRGSAGPAVRNLQYQIDTPGSSCPGTPELACDIAAEELELEGLTSARAFARQRPQPAKHYVLPSRQSVRSVVHSPEVATYDHRCRETRLPHVKKQDPRDEYLENMAKHEENTLPPLRMSLSPRHRTRPGWSATSNSSGGSDDSQLSLHKYDTVEEGERQANPQTLNFRTVQLPSGSTINVSFINEYNRHSYVPWAQ